MKKAVLLFLFILGIQLVSAVSIDSLKSSYSPYETMIVSISGDFSTSPQLKNIEFLRENKEVSVLYDMAKIGNKYYLSAIIPNQPGNYTLLLKNLTTLESGVIKSSEFRANFTVKSTNETIVQVSPGFVTAKDSFSIVFENKGSASQEVSAKFFKQDFKFVLSSGASKRIIFSIDGLKDDFGEIDIEAGSIDYTIPVKIIPKKSNNTVLENYQFSFKEKELNITLASKDEWVIQEELFNYALDDLTDISIEVLGDDNILDISPTKIDKISPGSSEKINITIDSSTPGKYVSILEASTGDLTTNFTLNLELTENITKLPETIDTTKCIDSGGLICGAAETCSKPKEIVGAEECCFGTCEVPGSGSGFITGLIIFALIAIAGAGIYFYVKSAKSKTSEDIIKERAQEFEKKNKL